jgi:hypothetical protein
MTLLAEFNLFRSRPSSVNFAIRAKKVFISSSLMGFESAIEASGLPAHALGQHR